MLSLLLSAAFAYEPVDVGTIGDALPEAATEDAPKNVIYQAITNVEMDGADVNARPDGPRIEIVTVPNPKDDHSLIRLRGAFGYEIARSVNVL